MSEVPSNLIPTRITQLPVAPVASEESLLLIVYQGNNYQITAGELLQVAGVPTTRQVIAGTGLQGGGQLSSNVTLSIAPGGVGSTQLANSGVTPGTYGTSTDIPVFTVDATGRVVAATTVSATISGYVPDSRQVIAGTGLTGGGALNNDVTLNANLSNSTPLSGDGAGTAGVATSISRSDHQHPAVNLGVDQEVDGILGLNNGGTARSIVPDEGGIVWCGADGLYVGPVGGLGQVLASAGAGEYTWANVPTDAPIPAHFVYIGPTSGPNASPSFRLLVSDDLPSTITGKTITGATITTSTAQLTLLDVDNIRVDGNTISSTDANGDINLTPNGTGAAVIQKVDINSGTIDGTTIGASSAAAGTFTSVSATTGNISTVNATTVDANNIEVTNLKAKDGTAAGSIADATGVVTLNSSVLTTTDINGGTIDGTTIGGNSPAAGTFTTATATTGNITDVNATTVDTTNIEVTNLKAKDGTAAGSIANTTGVVTLNSSVLTTTDINGGTIDNTVIGGTTPAAGTFTSVDTDYVDFAPALSPLPTDATGRLYYNNEDQFNTLAFRMNGAVVQKIGEEQYYRIKCQGAINKGQVVKFAGTLGASGGLIGAAATGLTPTQANYILGIANESGANNAWIFVTSFGEVKNIDTTGGAEAWVQGQELYYNPSVTGGLTKTKPTTPNAIVMVAAVVHVGTSNGILFVRPTFGSVLGGTDGNVEFTTLNNGDVIVYDGVQSRWENVAQSTLSVGSATSATTATNLAGGAAGSIPYQSASGITAMLAAGSGVLVGGSTPSYSTSPSLTGTNFTSIPNAALQNSAVTIGTTSISLGSTSLTLGGLTSVAVTQDPTTALQVATKQYVDGLVTSGVTYHAPVKYEVPPTTGNLNATYNNGTAGVGATLTNAGTLAAFAPDGPTASVNDRILIYNQTNQFENGVYEVTTLGDGSTPWVLTRTADADSYGLKDPNALGNGDAFFVTSGDTGAGELYVCNTAGTITFGTTAITFVQVSSAQIYSAGTGLTLTGTQFSLTTPVVLANGGTGLTSYTAGDLVYYATGTTFSKLAIGATNRILTSSGTAPQWTDPTTVTVGAATSATNVAGGTANQIVYNTGAGTTSFIVAPTVANTYLEWSGSAFQWAANPLGTVTSVDVSGGSTGLTFTGGPITTSGTITAGGTLAIANGGTNATATPTAGAIAYGSGTAYAFSAAGSASEVLLSGGSGAPTWAAQSSLSVGSATNATNTAITDDTSTNASMYLTWVTANTGNLPQKVTSTKLTFNPSTGVLTATGGVSGGTF